VIHVIVKVIHDFSKLLRGLTTTKGDTGILLTLARADEDPLLPKTDSRDPKKTEEERVFPGGRNFK
jgi:hypothetical protein